MRYAIPFVFLLFVLGASCEDDSGFVLPEVPGDYIQVTIDDWEDRYTQLGPDGTDLTYFAAGADVRGGNFLTINRYLSDPTVQSVQLFAEDIPIRYDKDSVPTLGPSTFPGGMIIINTSGLTGSIYCPHEDEQGGSIAYQGLWNVETLSREGRLRGTFSMTQKEAHAAALDDVRFDIIVPIR